MQRWRRIIGDLVLTTAALLGIGGFFIEVYLKDMHGTNLVAVGGFLVVVGSYIRHEIEPPS